MDNQHFVYLSISIHPNEMKHSFYLFFFQSVAIFSLGYWVSVSSSPAKTPYQTTLKPSLNASIRHPTKTKTLRMLSVTTDSVIYTSTDLATSLQRTNVLLSKSLTNCGSPVTMFREYRIKLKKTPMFLSVLIETSTTFCPGL